MRHFLTPLLFAATAIAGNAMAATGPQLEADSLSYDVNTHVRTASGNAVFVHDGVTLEADNIYFEEATQTAHAVGNVRVTRPDYRLVTNDLSYRLDDKTFSCAAFRIGYPPVFLEGKSAHGNLEKLELENVTVYAGEPEPSSPTLSAEHMTLSAGKRLLSVGTTPGIGHHKLFRIPRISGGLEQLPNVDANVDVGFDNNLGAYANVEAKVPVTTGLALGANLGLYSKRGVMAGPAASYRYDKNDTEIAASLSSGFIRDQGELGYDYFLDPVPENRWFFQERYQQSTNDRVYVTSYVNLMSDPEMMRDFRPEFYNSNQFPDSYVEATVIVSDDVVASALTRFTAASADYAVTQRLPELRVDFLTNPLPFGGLYQTGYIDAAVMNRSVNDQHLNTRRLHAFYGLSRPISLTNWLQFVPKAGGFLGCYDRSYDYTGFNYSNQGTATHFIGELGADLYATFHAEWEYKNKLWNIDGLRHVLRPIASIRRYGSAGDDNLVGIDSDYNFYPVQMPSIDLRDLEGNDIDYIVYNKEFLRSGIENILETRDAGFSRELASLNLYHDSNFNDHYLDETYSQISLSPLKFLRFSYENGFDTNPMANQWSRARMTIKSADQWALQLYADYYGGYYEDYVASYSYQLTRDWSTLLSIGYDARAAEIDRLSASLFQDVGSFWRIRYRVSYRKDDLRHDDFSVSIAIATVNF